MIESIRIRGFRALRDVELRFPPGKPIVLIGENGSGKSTILEALALLGATAHGRAGRAILDRGGWEAVAWAGTATEIELGVRFAFAEIHAPIEYVVRFGKTRTVPTVLNEWVRVYSEADGAPVEVLRGGGTSQAMNWLVQPLGQYDIILPAPSDGSIGVNATCARGSRGARTSASVPAPAAD